MPNILTAMLVLTQAGSTSLPALDVTGADIQATLENAIGSGVTDTPIRTIDAGGHHVGVAIVHRGPSANVVAGRSTAKSLRSTVCSTAQARWLRVAA